MGLNWIYWEYHGYTMNNFGNLTWLTNGNEWGFHGNNVGKTNINHPKFTFFYTGNGGTPSSVFTGVCLIINHLYSCWDTPIVGNPHIYWLVVSNMFFPYIWNNNSIWLIFFRGVETTNQIYIGMNLQVCCPAMDCSATVFFYGILKGPATDLGAWILKRVLLKVSEPQLGYSLVICYIAIENGRRNSW